LIRVIRVKIFSSSEQRIFEHSTEKLEWIGWNADGHDPSPNHFVIQFPELPLGSEMTQLAEILSS
jgi:hypothetical protein